MPNLQTYTHLRRRKNNLNPFCSLCFALAAAASFATTTTLEYEDVRETNTLYVATNYTASAITSATNSTLALAQASITSATNSTLALAQAAISSATNSTLALAQAAISSATNSALELAQASITSATNALPAWAKADSKPSYTLNEVAPNYENMLGKQGDAGRFIKILAQTRNGIVDGGVKITESTLNNNNQTTYMRGGVAVKKSGVNQDYMWDSGTSGIVRFKDLNPVSNRVSALETWAIGDDTQLRIDHAGETNAVIEVAYTNRLMYSSAQESTNTYNRARSYTDSAIIDALGIVDAAKADRAWGRHTSGGAPAPEDALVVEKSKVELTGGGNYSYIESSTGGYWVMAVSLGSEWTLESLADAQNPTNAATMVLRDAEGNAVQTVSSTSSREAYAASGEQYISCVNVGGNDVITISYPIEADSPPDLLFSPVTAGLEDFHDASFWPMNIASVVASGHSGMWTNTVTMVGAPGLGYFRAKYIKAGTVYTNFNKPLGLSEIVIAGTNYTVHVETIGGKKLLVLED